MESSSQFNNLNFVNTAYNNLSIEKTLDNSSRKVRGFNFSVSETEEKEGVQLAALSSEALKLLEIDAEKLKNEPESIEILAGNKIPEKAKVLAHCYCGYQFGSWANQLGDGRAHLLGDIQNSKGELWELQYKGSGKTPYSRFADGKAVIRSSVREFLCSEAMHALGIPTTRAASLIVSETLAERDKLYTGKVIKERCAVVLRLSPTFLRFGSFQICVNEPGEPGPSVLMEEKLLPQILDYTIKFHYPEIWAQYPDKIRISNNFKVKQKMYLQMYEKIVKRTALLVAKWQSVGFVHGVLNTDNMSIIGVTIDYGPYEFIDHFSKQHISNHSDKTGRYSYEQQPEVCKWNLGKLAEAIEPVLDLNKSKTALNRNYETIYEKEYLRLFRNKLGLQKEEEKDIKLIESLIEVMDENMSEFTNTFKLLKKIQIEKVFTGELSQEDLNTVNELVDLSPNKEYILSKKKPIASVEQLLALQKLGRQNPMQLRMMGADEQFVENELVKAIAYEELEDIEQEDLKIVYRSNWVNWIQQYKDRLEIEVKDENNVEQIQENRQKLMQKSNPQFVLRNYIAEEIIEKSEKNDFKPLNEALKLLQDPFKEPNTDDEQKVCKIGQTTPSWAKGLCVSCSS